MGAAAATVDDKNGYEVVPPKRSAESGGYEIVPPAQKLTDEPDQPGLQPKPGIADSENRTFKAAGQTLLGMPKALYHAAADPMTSDEEAEKEKYLRGGEPVGPIGRGIYRGIVAPVARASEYWSDKAKGNIPSEDSSILPDSTTLGVLPEALGGAGGAVVGGEAAPKAIGAIKNVPRLARAGMEMLPDASDLAPKGIALGKLAAKDAASHIPVAGRLFTRPSIGDYINAARTPGKPFQYSGPAGPKMESGNMSPIDGEYLPPETPKGLGAGLPMADAREVMPWENPAPSVYRRGIGEVEPDEIAPPDPFVLGRRQGIRVQPPRARLGLLPEAPPEVQPFGVSPSRRVAPEIDADADWQSIMRDDLENHGIRARREQSRGFREGNDVSKPKWQLNAEANAELARQQILQQAARSHDNPLAGLPRVNAKVPRRAIEMPDATPDDQIMSKLEESVKQAKAKKSGGVESTSVPSKIHKETGLPLNEDGTVTLYHGTSADGAAAIRKSGTLKSAGEPDVYLTTDKGGGGYGDTVVPVRVKPSTLSLDDEFPNGRKDYRLSVKKPGGSVKVKIDE